MSGKVNPRRVVKTQADVDKAFDRGVRYGVSSATAIFMNVLLDKFNGADHIADVWVHVVKLSEEVAEGRVHIRDIEQMLKDEYDIVI